MSTEIDIVERLRHAHEHSQQRIVGSDIFKAAADEIEKLRAERDAAVCCDGCGSMLTDAEIIEMRKSDPKIISCCPERKPLTIQQWRKRAHDFEAAARDMRERCKAAVMYRAEVWKNAVEADVHSPCGQALWEECEDIANHIGAFPLLATEGNNG